MIFWKKSFEKFITVLPCTTSSFLPVLFKPPGYQASVHISLYLPTSGLESEFVEEISALRTFIEEHLEKNPEHLLYIRGDTNVNSNHTTRVQIFRDFLSKTLLKSIEIGHKTYHHFIGNGLFDSNIDAILCSENCQHPEQVERVFCKSDYPSIASHHDLILSSFSLPLGPEEKIKDYPDIPTIDNNRVKILWSDDDIPHYQDLVSDNLAMLRERWLTPGSKSSIGLLLEMTSHVLSSAAISSNKSISLSTDRPARSSKVPWAIKKSHLNLLKLRRTPINDNKLRDAKTQHRRLIRTFAMQEDYSRDESFFCLLSSNSSSIFRKIRASKSAKKQKIQYLKVGNKEYHGEYVKNGFFDSLSSLKTRSNLDLLTSDFNEDYLNILDICEYKKDLPNISVADSFELLRRMKNSVNDLNSISTLHYLNAGKEGVIHFHFILNSIIDDVNTASIDELNSVYALLLHKGHSKPQNLSNSYRTISTCPVVSTALDLYIRDIYLDTWSKEQASTQYQGQGSSHELAALLITELVQHSLHTLKEPIYLLFLDAKSAFDTVLPELLVRNLYKSGMEGDTLTYLNHRFTNRKTFVEWDNTLMGPIPDEHGMEQGNKNSSDFYKLYNNDLLKVTQNSGLGIPLKSQTISSVGLADDTVLAANKLSNLYNILYLAMDYCNKYSVSICSSKTKLLKISKVDDRNIEQMNPIRIDGDKIAFSETADHVGVLRSSCGSNLPNLMRRIAAHKKALSATLFTGLAQRHRGNPVVGLKVNQIYGTPVLMSGLASLVLTEAELSMLDKHFKKTIQNIQKLHPKTPDCFVYFLGGCLPARAELHSRQLSRFGMVARLRGNPLNIHARNILTDAKNSCKSWFIQIRNISAQYKLPHPLIILENPPCKEEYAKLVKSHIIDYWENKLRGEACLLPSLKYCNFNFMSLALPHSVWQTAQKNPHEISKAIQQARFLSGRYRSAYLTRHWDKKNPEGLCQAETCDKIREDTKHILLECKMYNQEREKLTIFWLENGNEIAQKLAKEALNSNQDYLLQFILDCSVLPSVISATQQHGYVVLEKLFHLTRTWCFVMHRQRMRMLGRWNFQ